MESNHENDQESPSSLKSITQVKTGGILTLPSVGLAEAYALTRILEEKLTTEANLYTSQLGKAIAMLATGAGKLRQALEAIGDITEDKDDG